VPCLPTSTNRSHPGMTGGIAYIWDPEQRFEFVANPDAIDWYSLVDMEHKHIEVYEMMLKIHMERTGSARAADLLKEWGQTLSDTLMIVPKEISQRVLGDTKIEKVG
ncbi:MAG: hypothetical protein AAGK93_08120, partial [Pseudomonadota bacterium]